MFHEHFTRNFLKDILPTSKERKKLRKKPSKMKWSLAARYSYSLVWICQQVVFKVNFCYCFVVNFIPNPIYLRLVALQVHHMPTIFLRGASKIKLKKVNTVTVRRLIIFLISQGVHCWSVYNVVFISTKLWRPWWRQQQQ